ASGRRKGADDSTCPCPRHDIAGCPFCPAQGCARHVGEGQRRSTGSTGRSVAQKHALCCTGCLPAEQQYFRQVFDQGSVAERHAPQNREGTGSRRSVRLLPRKRLAFESKFLAACDRLSQPTFYTYSAKDRCGEIEHSSFW